MAVENFTSGWTEHDTSGFLTIAAAKVTAADLVADDTACHIKDGAQDIDDFTWYVDGYVDTDDAGSSSSYFLAGLGDTSDEYTGCTEYVGIMLRGNSVLSQYCAKSRDDGSGTFRVITNKTLYYYKIARVGTTLTVTRYSDSGHETELDNSSVTCPDAALDYVSITGNNAGINGNRHCDFYFENLDLQEAVAGINIPLVMQQHNHFSGGMVA